MNAVCASGGRSCIQIQVSLANGGTFGVVVVDSLTVAGVFIVCVHVRLCIDSRISSNRAQVHLSRLKEGSGGG